MGSAFIVSSHLPETPAFLKLQAERDSSSDPELGRDKATAVPKTPWQVWVLSAGAFFGGLTMSAGISMQAVFLSNVYHLDVLHVTYVSVGSAVTLVLTGMFLSARVRNILGTTWTVVVMNSFGGFLYLFMAQCGYNGLNIWFFVVSVWLAAMQSSVAGASTGPLLNAYCETANRGKINSTNQLCTNLGRMLGPLTYGHLAVYDINLVWIVAGVALFVKAFLTLFIRVQKEEKGPTLSKKGTMYGESWEDEVGSSQDEQELGRFVATLLTKGHYKWV